MTTLMTETLNGEPYRYYPLGNHVVRAVGICGGRPTFKYTRIEIAGTLDRLVAAKAWNGLCRAIMGACHKKRSSRQRTS